MLKAKISSADGNILYIGWLDEIPLSDEQVSLQCQKLYYKKPCAVRKETVKCLMRSRILEAVGENTVKWMNVPEEIRNYLDIKNIEQFALYDD